jgi:methyl acetate hydrolase
VRTSVIDDVLRAATAARVPGVVAAVTDAHGLIYRGAFGVADAVDRRPVTFDTIFRIASMTKLVTTVCVMQLVEKGAVETDAPFKRYYGPFRQPPVLRAYDFATGELDAVPARSDITVHELLTHTSGYGYWFLDAALRAASGPVPELFDPPFLVSEPGSSFVYGVSTDVLGQIIPSLTHVPLDAYFDEHVLGPLGMRDTSFVLPPLERLATLHAEGAHGFQSLPNETEGEPPRGGGALYSTVDDYLALLRVFLNGGRAGARWIISADSVATIVHNQLGNLMPERQTTAAPARTADFGFMSGSQQFGYGVLIETEAEPGRRSAGSYGWGGIFNTFFWLDPSAEIAGAIFMQSSPFCSPACLSTYEAFERAVYAELGG